MRQGALDLVVVGAGGMALDCIEIVEALQAAGRNVSIRGFLSDIAEDRGRIEELGFEMLGPTARVDTLRGQAVIIAIGNGRARKAFAERTKNAGAHATSIVHPTATIGRSSSLGAGAIVGPGVRITTNVVVGSHCILNVNASLSHGARCGDFCTVNPSAVLCGDVTLGDGVTCGANCTVLEKRSVGSWTTIGAGSLVRTDLPEDVVAVGSPTRIIRESA